MKVVAYYALHYGSEWLHWSLQSIRDQVDEIVVVYSPRPSHGTKTMMINPDSRERLMSIVEPFGVHWFTDTFTHEGAHRDEAVNICTRQFNADIVLPIDFDEVWEAEMLQDAVKFVASQSVRNWRVPMKHYWRSMTHVCLDGQYPVRVIDARPSAMNKEAILPHDRHMHHFGYAQSARIIHYKWQIHGHISELRPDWFQKKFLAWHPEHPFDDVHPVSVGLWNPEFQDRSELPELLHTHPYYDKEIIL